MLLPTRTAVLSYLYNVRSAGMKEIVEALKSQYDGEQQFTRERYPDRVMSPKASGLLDLGNYRLDETEELSLRYIIDEGEGAAVEKYVPRRYRQCS